MSFQDSPRCWEWKEFERGRERNSEIETYALLGKTAMYWWFPQIPSGGYKTPSARRMPLYAPVSDLYFRPHAAGNCAESVVSNNVPSSSLGISIGSSLTSSQTWMNCAIFCDDRTRCTGINSEQITLPNRSIREQDACRTKMAPRKKDAV